MHDRQLAARIAIDPPLKSPTTAAVFKRRAMTLAVTMLLTGLALVIGLVLERLLRLPNILLIFLPVVLFVAVRFGLAAASFASLLSVLATSFFLAAPTMSFAVSDPNNFWALVIFLAVAVVTSSLAAQVRQRAAAVDRHSRIVESLYEFSSTLGAISDGDELVAEAARRIALMLNVRVLLLVPEADTLRVVAGEPRRTGLADREHRAAEWCWMNGKPAGRSTDVFRDARHLFLPLDVGRGTAGVLGLDRDTPGPLLNPDEVRLLDTLVRQVALNIERANLAREIHQSEMLAATEKLRTALLTSISHDLRTPLASVLGNVTSLRRYGHLYDDSTRLETLTAIEEETRRLSLFVDNLLHMTRIDAGALRPTFEAADVSDLIGSALKRVEKRLADHRVRTVLAPDLPMTTLDFVLAEHVLVNILENAAKFAPRGTEIAVSAAHRDRETVIRVEDQGPGIAPVELPRIFERFFRATATDHRPAGVGLGLSVCKGFVEAMGGLIEAENRDAGGLAVTIRFPDAAEEEES